MYQTIGAIPYNTILTQRQQTVSLFPNGQDDQLQIASMKLGSRRRRFNRTSSARTPQLLAS